MIRVSDKVKIKSNGDEGLVLNIRKNRVDKYVVDTLEYIDYFSEEEIEKIDKFGQQNILKLTKEEIEFLKNCVVHRKDFLYEFRDFNKDYNKCTNMILKLKEKLEEK